MTPAALDALVKGDIENFVVASTPGGIEAQEAAGQRDLVARFNRLPTKFLSHCLDTDMPKGWLEKVGFKVGDVVSGDDIWTAVTPPDGWTLRPTEHDMWSEVRDDKGRLRISVFYKAAFYDRNCHASIVPRYQIDTKYDGDYETGTRTRFVVDNANGEVLFNGGIEPQRFVRDAPQKDAYYQCKKFLEQHFPNYVDELHYDWH